MSINPWDDEVVSERAGGVEILTMGGGALAALAKSEIDVQISTAKHYPRSIRRCRDEAMALATLDEETAATMFYALPRGGKKIEGPSARLAEVVVYAWGNIRAQAVVTDVGDKFVTALGTCFDLEKNIAVQVEVRRRITNSSGRRFDDDMIVVTGNAAASIAFRNAVFKAIPFALFKPVYEQARLASLGQAKTMTERRGAALDWFAKAGISEARVLAVLGRAGVEEITMEDLITLTGLRTAIKDGDTTVDEAFPTESGGRSAPAASAKVSDLNERIGAKKKATEPEPAPAEWTPGDDFPIPDPVLPEPRESQAPITARERYDAALSAHGITGDADRRALQKRLHAEGRVSSSNRTAWTDDDYAAALATLTEIPNPDQEG